MEQVKVGLMLPGAYPFNDQNVNPTWKAHVKTHESVVVAYIKKVSPRDLYVECVCATIGRALGLPIPMPMIVKVTHDSLNEVPEGESVLAFGSEDAGYPSFRRYVKSEEAMEKLRAYSKCLDIGVFDEWIANWDRNLGNILYDGGENFSFIDHENAIDLTLSESDAARDNQILKVFYSCKSEFEKYKINRDVELNITPIYKDFPFSLISEKTYASSYLSQEEIIDVIQFIENRTLHIKTLLSQRLGIKQQDLAL